MGAIRLWQDKGSIIHDTIGTYDFEENFVAATIIEFFQELSGIIF